MKKAVNAYLSPFDNMAEPPEWVHLIPAGQFTGADGRGPFEIVDAAALMAASLPDGRKLPIDINHAIDLKKDGDATPAQAWIVDLEMRGDGLWGRVEWTLDGDWAVRSKAYGYLSPVFLHSKDAPFKVMRLLRAALTNDPNLTQLKSLHMRTDEESDMLEQLRKALGLPETATEAEILGAVSSAHAASNKYDALVKRVGGLVATDGDENAVVTALQTRLSSGNGNSETIVSLNSQIAELSGTVTTLNKELTTLKSTHAQDRAVAVIDEAVKEGKVFPALRDHYVARHAKDPDGVEAELKLLPSIHAGGLGGKKPTAEDDKGLSDADRAVIAQMNISEEEFLKNRKLEKGV